MTKWEFVWKLRRLLTHRLSDVLISDNAQTFKVKNSKVFLKKNKISHIFSAPYHPASNGQGYEDRSTFHPTLKSASKTRDLADFFKQSFTDINIGSPLRLGYSKLEKDFSYNINKTGCFILTSDKYRHGYQNFSDCISKLENIIAEASKPEPCMSLETIEIIKNRIKKASIKRVDKKRNKSYVKKFRSSNIKDFE
ncbi:K02A2.6-like [Cordylochernes scorpioides]|uniref:K02A2.6-like n=1 Tax=Cordylochernes scorpioides TaxID=51811 RepID=A0ABY6LC59_9ARAC|nr:K02A2.6-like [Cordylochernes scorpioides]